MTRVLGRYVFKEVGSPFILGTFILSFVALMPQVLKLAEQVLAFGIGIYGFGLLIMYLLPPVLLFVVPAAFLLAVLVAFGRLSADSEMIAVRAGGVSLWQLLPPVLVLGIFASLITAGMSSYGEPWGRSQIKNFIFKLGETKAAGLVQPRTFNEDFFGFVIYADAVSADSRLENVFLADERDPKQRFAVHARQGLVIADPGRRSIVLRLVDGTVDHIAATAEEPVTRVTFAQMDYNILPETTVDLSGVDPYEMYPGELYQFLLEKGEKAKGRDWMAFHKKFAYPISALLMGILGMALGISDPRHGKGRGYIYGLGVMVLYYLLVRFGDGFGDKRVIPPLVAAWLPNAVFLVFGVWLFAAQAREEETFVQKFFARFSR